MPTVYPGDIVTVVNRTSKPLFYTYDSREYTLDPGENPVLSTHVHYAKSQNVQMGSQDPYDTSPGSRVYLVGLRAKKGQKQKDDISPLEQSDAIEILDRSLLDGDAQTATLMSPARGARTRPSEVRSQGGHGAATEFSNPVTEGRT